MLAKFTLHILRQTNEEFEKKAASHDVTILTSESFVADPTQQVLNLKVSTSHVNSMALQDRRHSPSIIQCTRKGRRLFHDQGHTRKTLNLAKPLTIYLNVYFRGRVPELLLETSMRPKHVRCSVKHTSRECMAPNTSGS